MSHTSVNNCPQRGSRRLATACGDMPGQGTCRSSPAKCVPPQAPRQQPATTQAAGACRHVKTNTHATVCTHNSKAVMILYEVSEAKMDTRIADDAVGSLGQPDVPPQPDTDAQASYRVRRDGSAGITARHTRTDLRLRAGRGAGHCGAQQCPTSHGPQQPETTTTC